MGLHHLHHKLASAQALARFLTCAEPGGTVVAAASAPMFGAPPKPVMRPLVAVELLPCASICSVPPMKRSQAYCPATCASARLDRRWPSAPTGNISARCET